MSNFVNSIDAVGEMALVNSIIDRSITEYKDDVITVMGYAALARCTSLTLVDTPAICQLSGVSLGNCSALTALILRGATVCTITTNTLTNTPIESGAGYIYVPSALLETYKAATNWSAYADQFRALEDYTVDGTTTGELDETKV